VQSRDPVGEAGGDIARVAAICAGYGDGVPGVQINRFCASGLDAVVHGAPPQGIIMKLPCRALLQLAAGVAALPAVTRVAKAQTYPARPITMIVPFPPGGGADGISRVVAERMRASLGQPIIMEN